MALSFRPHQGIILFNQLNGKPFLVLRADDEFPSPSGDYFI